MVIFVCDGNSALTKIGLDEQCSSYSNNNVI